MKYMSVLLRRGITFVVLLRNAAWMVGPGAVGVLRSRALWLGILMVLAAGSLGMLYTLERMENAFVVGDRQWSQREYLDAWRKLGQSPESFVLKRLGYEDDYTFRQALAALDTDHLAVATAMFNKAAKSEDSTIASAAHTNVGLVAVQLGIKVRSQELLQLAANHFAQAIYLDDNNSDAKYDLELLLAKADELDISIGIPKQGRPKEGEPRPGGFTPPDSGY